MTKSIKLLKASQDISLVLTGDIKVRAAARVIMWMCFYCITYRTGPNKMSDELYKLLISSCFSVTPT